MQSGSRLKSKSSGRLSNSPLLKLYLTNCSSLREKVGKNNSFGIGEGQTTSEVFSTDANSAFLYTNVFFFLFLELLSFPQQNQKRLESSFTQGASS